MSDRQPQQPKFNESDIRTLRSESARIDSSCIDSPADDINHRYWFTQIKMCLQVVAKRSVISTVTIEYVWDDARILAALTAYNANANRELVRAALDILKLEIFQHHNYRWTACGSQCILCKTRDALAAALSAYEVPDGK